MSVALGSSSSTATKSTYSGNHPLLAALSGELQPRSSSLLYGLVMMVVLVPILLLPLLLLGVIALVGWGVYYHATEHLHWFTEANVKVLGFVMYAGPVLGGLAVIAFMIKPFFAPRRPETVNPYSLERDQEPLLFAFVERLAVLLGAPAPNRIEVDCVPNASASFRRGLRSMLGNDLTLTIGMPLVAAMNVRQLTGVLAHELGHFTQGAGMRSTYLVARINGWFARIIYERDAWDDKLEYHARHSSFLWTLLLAWCCVFCVWLTRRIFWVFMFASGAISCLMLRHMEFDADEAQVRVSGSDAFVESFNRLFEIDCVFSQRAYKMADARKMARLADDLPAYVAATIETLPEEMRAEMRRASDVESKGLFNTHPSARARMKRAQELAQPGLFTVEEPASALFTNFKTVCRWTTLGFYHVNLDESISPEELKPTEQLLERTRIGIAAHLAAERFYQCVSMLGRPFAVDVPSRSVRADAEPAALLRIITQARERIVEAAPPARQAFDDLRAAHGALSGYIQAEALRKASVRIKLSDYDLSNGSNEAIAQAKAAAEERIAAASRLLRTFDEHVTARLIASLQLLHRPELESKLKSAPKLRKHTAALCDALRSINEVDTTVNEMIVAIDRLRALAFHAMGGEQDEAFIGKLNAAAGAVHDKLTSLNAMLRDTPYPMEHGREAMSVAAAIIGTLPNRDDPMDVGGTADHTMQELIHLRIEIMHRLALICERVERACGLKPLQKPLLERS